MHRTARDAQAKISRNILRLQKSQVGPASGLGQSAAKRIYEIQGPPCIAVTEVAAILKIMLLVAAIISTTMETCRASSGCLLLINDSFHPIFNRHLLKPRLKMSKTTCGPLHKWAWNIIPLLQTGRCHQMNPAIYCVSNCSNWSSTAAASC